MNCGKTGSFKGFENIRIIKKRKVRKFIKIMVTGLNTLFIINVVPMSVFLFIVINVNVVFFFAIL